MDKLKYLEKQNRKQNRRRYILVAAALICAVVSGAVGWSVADASSQKEVSTEQISEDTVLVGGMPVGIYMETDGVLVLNTQNIKAIDGKSYEPAHNLVKAGDYIVAMNGTEIHNKQELMETIQRLQDAEVVLTLRRNSDTTEVKLDAVEWKPQEYKLGIWVRDNVQGLGTITFLNQNSEFGALGHGIHDADTSVLMQITNGSLYKTSIRSIVKGEDGMPGSMEGLIVYNRYNRLGTIQKNSDAGIYGTLDEIDTLFEEQVPVRVAAADEVETGDAEIRCYIDGEVQEYKVRILETDTSPREINKGIILEVTDSALLDKTGGIIQGMSGSPILQNGKLVGAVTHVFVNDPTKGYGIFAETMLSELEN